MIRKLFFLLIFSILLISFVKAEVIISEVMYDLDGSDSGREWIEIYSGEEINLSGWKFYEAETNHRLNLTKGSESFSGYAIIADNAGKFLEDNPDFDGNLFDSTFSLANTNETIALKDASLDIIDEITYLSIKGANGNGYSLQLVDEDWCEGAPTPGEDNECKAEEPEDNPDAHDLDENITGNNESLNDTINNTIITNNSSSNISNNSTNNVSSSNTNANKASISTKAVSTPAAKASNNNSEINGENITENEEKKVIYQSKNDRLKGSALYLMIGLFVLLFFYLFKSNKI